MADNTAIEWTDATWNPVTGCSVVSPGCTNCYAMRLAGTRLKHTPSRKGLTRETKAGPVWTGEVRLNEQWLDQPLRWRRPRRIFVCAHGDLFAEGVPDEVIDRVFAVMALAPQHTFQVLSKRAARMRRYIRNLPNRDDLVAREAVHIWGGKDPDALFDQVMRAVRNPLPNVWLGVSVEDQKRADERIPDLLATPAAIRFVSAEPLLGPIDMTAVRMGSLFDEQGVPLRVDTLRPATPIRCGIAGDIGRAIDRWAAEVPKLDWVIVGGESGTGARPMHPDWSRSIRDQCAGSGTAFFFKQWGEWAPLRPDLIPTPTKRQAWVHVDSGRACRAKASSDLDALDREEDKAGRPLYAHMLDVGKKRAGRLLDGVEHSAFPHPEVRAERASKDARP